MGYFEASIMFLVGLIAFAVMFPVGLELLPSMRESMGGTVVSLVSAMFVIILAAAFFIYIRDSQRPDQYMGTEMGGQNY